MVLSQKSVLGQLANITRRVTLITEPTYSTSTGSWLVNGLDADKQQHQIDLTVLPPGVFLSLIKKGQQWFIERRTTYNRLFMYVGELDVSTVDFKAEGDLLVGTGPQTAEILSIGNYDEVLTVRGGTAEWIPITTISGIGPSSITEITSEDDSVIVTNPFGPIVNLAVTVSSGGGGTVTEITSDGSITVTNPFGPVVNLSANIDNLTFQIPLAYALIGPLTSGYTYPGPYVPVPGSQTTTLLECYGSLSAGTATVSLLDNGTGITGLTGLSVTTSPTSYTPSPYSLSNNDFLQLQCTAQSGTGDLSFTMYISIGIST